MIIDFLSLGWVMCDSTPLLIRKDWVVFNYDKYQPVLVLILTITRVDSYFFVRK